MDFQSLTVNKKVRPDIKTACVVIPLIRIVEKVIILYSIKKKKTRQKQKRHHLTVTTCAEAVWGCGNTWSHAGMF